ncbi:MAG: glycosyltransferase family 39 protein, partial [Bryobacteraceae bacterium]
MLVLIVVGLNLASRAAEKPFWFDEILTLRVARQPIGRPMWRAMTAGFEFNPPAIYVATQISEKLFGRGSVTSRLPAILAGIAVFFCAYCIAARTGGAVTGFWAMLFLAASGLMSYFYEARGYALVLAGTMLSWLSWQHLPKARHRPIALAGIVVGLLVALASHMWAFVIPGCFVAGEITRWIRTGSRDPRSLAAIMAPLIVAFTYPPLVAATRGIHFGGPVYNNSLLLGYMLTLYKLPVLWVVCTIVLAAATLFSRNSLASSVELRSAKGATRGTLWTELPRRQTEKELAGSSGAAEQAHRTFGARCAQLRPETAPVLREFFNGAAVEDTVLALSLAMAPVAIWAMTGVVHTNFMTRYCLIAGLGFAFMLAQFLASFSGWAHRAVTGLLMAVGLAFTGQTIHGVLVRDAWHTKSPLTGIFASLGKFAKGDQPIVYSNGIDFLQADYYAPPALAKRFAYVADRQLEIKFTNTDGVDSAFLLGPPYLKLRGKIISYADLRGFQGGFWLVGASSPPNDVLNWIDQKL